MIDFALVAERPADVMNAVVFATSLRREQHVVETPLTYSKVKTQIARAREINPSFIVIINGDTTSIIVRATGARYEASTGDALSALLDYWNDDASPEEPLAKQLEADFSAWLAQ